MKTRGVTVGLSVIANTVAWVVIVMVGVAAGAVQRTCAGPCSRAIDKER